MRAVASVAVWAVRCPSKGYEGTRRRLVGGSILIGVLWCVVLLAVLVIGILYTTRLDLTVGKYHADRIQAHYLALAGIEKAKALLYEDALQRSRSGIHHGIGLYDSPGDFRDVSLGRGQFRVLRPGRDDEGGGIIYGVSDEESRLNINVAEAGELTKIAGLTPDIAGAIIDWRDSDSTVSPSGAEAPYYASLQPPYLPRDGPFPTIRELLMVRGITRDLLFGEPPTTTSAPSSNPSTSRSGPSTDEEADALYEGGWSAWLTAFSSVQNIDASGVDRINVQTADEAALTGVRGITSAIAKAIVASRGRNQLQSLADLLEVAAPAPPGRVANIGQPGGPKVINETLLKEIADHLKVDDRTELPGAVNINSAGVEVLLCLPGMTRPLAQAIVAQRRANGFFPHIAALLEVPGLTHEIFRQVAPKVAVRSETFRILSEGRASGSGTRQRIEAVVHIGRTSVTTLAYREDDL